MSTRTKPTRVEEDLWLAAEAAAKQSHRSLAQQINRWARLGRQLEKSPTITLRNVQQVLANNGNYDALNEYEQALVRAEWEIKIEERRESLNFADEFSSKGYSWSEIDDQGNLILQTGKHNQKSTGNS